MFSPSQDKIEELYASLQTEFKIEDGGELNKYLRTELDYRPDRSIHLRQCYLFQRIINMIPGMDKYSAKPTPAINSPLNKYEVSQAKKKSTTDPYLDYSTS